jgi:hypothetical protein
MMSTILIDSFVNSFLSHVAQDAMCLFIKLWSTLNLFGTEFLSCINFDTKEKGLLGVSKEKVHTLDVEYEIFDVPPIDHVSSSKH